MQYWRYTSSADFYWIIIKRSAVFVRTSTKPHYGAFRTLPLTDLNVRYTSFPTPRFKSIGKLPRPAVVNVLCGFVTYHMVRAENEGAVYILLEKERTTTG